MTSHTPVTDRILDEVQRTHGCNLEYVDEESLRPVLEPGFS
jgi:hypothetical protein